jgi:hypothetical protein
MNALDECIDEFIAAEHEAREALVKKYFEEFKGSFREPDGVVVETVSSLLAT